MFAVVQADQIVWCYGLADWNRWSLRLDLRRRAFWSFREALHGCMHRLDQRREFAHRHGVIGDEGRNDAGRQFDRIRTNSLMTSPAIELPATCLSRLPGDSWVFKQKQCKSNARWSFPLNVPVMRAVEALADWVSTELAKPRLP